jgi:hypothetical protein
LKRAKSYAELEGENFIVGQFGLASLGQRQLGHPKWEQREAATKDIEELSIMAIAQSKEASTQSSDAEIRRRSVALLTRLEN